MATQIVLLDIKTSINNCLVELTIYIFAEDTENTS